MLNDLVDSAPDEVGGMQHKFRWVVCKGKKKKAHYILDENSNKHYYDEPQTDAYVINGSIPMV